MRILFVILLALPLVSFGPPPAAPAVYWTRIGVVQTQHLASPHAQACTWDIAPARLRQEIVDPIGYPFGVVTAFSCGGDTAAVVAELNQRAGAMQEEAAAYRQAHPIAGRP